MSEKQRAMVEYTTQDLIAFLMEDFEFSLEDAMSRVYSSTTFGHLTDVATGLYLEGSAYVYELLKEETLKG